MGVEFHRRERESGVVGGRARANVWSIPVASPLFTENLAAEYQYDLLCTRPTASPAFAARVTQYITRFPARW